MILDLRDVATYYINLDRHVEKRDNMEKVIKDFGFKNAKRFSGCDVPTSSIIGCASSHLEVLSSMRSPSIILEDDCEIQNINQMIQVPDDADAIYLGLSSWAFNGKDGTEWKHSFNKVAGTRHVHRVANMLATHAILYLSQEYIDACTRVAAYCSKNEVHVDCGFAEIQKFYNVYALSQPKFYQSSNTEFTKINFDMIRKMVL